jgi:Cytochrome C'
MSVDRGIERSQTVAGRAALFAAVALSGCALSIFSPLGCGPAPSVPTPSSATGSSTAARSGSAVAAGQGAEGERAGAEHTDSQGRKWLGDVPYDVFYDDPLAVAAEGRTEVRSKGAAVDASPKEKATVAAGESPSNSAAPAGAANRSETGNNQTGRGGAAATTSAGAAKPAGSGTDWSALIDSDTLDAEVRRIRTELTAGMQSVGKYNARYQEIAVSGATLAALAEIVAEESGAASWKQHAASVRDLAASIHDTAKALGGQAYQATKNSSDQLMDVLDGNLPAGLPASEPIRDFAQVANRSALMKRMDRSFQRLKKGGTAQQLLKKYAGQATEDAAMLAVLSRVITVGHYDSADDPKYRGHSTELTRSATDLATAAKSGEAPAFADALTRIQKRCDACHADFRF